MKKILSAIVLLTIFSFCCDSIAQPQLKWIRCIGGSELDWIYSSTIENDSTVVFLATTGSLDGDIDNNTGKDTWVGKINASHQITKQSFFNSLNVTGTFNDFGQEPQIVKCPDGGYIAIGIVYGLNWGGSPDTTFNGGMCDINIVKLSPSLSVEWSKYFGGSEDDYAYSILSMDDGGFVFAGESNSMDSDLSGVHPPTAVRNAWVVKITNDGSILWQRCFGGISGDGPLKGDGATKMIRTSDGGFLFTGFTTISNELLHNQGGSDVWIVKLDSLGVLEWQRSFGSTGFDDGKTVIQTSDGGYLIAAQIGAGGPEVSGYHKDDDIWLLKLNSAGVLEWQQAYGGSRRDDPRVICQMADSSYIILAATSSIDGDISYNLDDYYNIWLLRINAQGKKIWDKCLNLEYASSMLPIAPGRFLISGLVRDTDSSAGPTYHGGTFDGFICEVDDPSLLSVKPTVSTETNTVTPNPAQDEIQIPSNIGSVSIYNLLGNEVLHHQQTEPTGHPTTIDIHSLPAGTYLVKMEEGDTVVTQKIIIDR